MIPSTLNGQDTIAAIATAMNEAGIGIIRISGPDAILKITDLFVTKKGVKALQEFRANTIHFGYIVDPSRENEKIDEVMISIMKAPHSYTTEDTVEINTHGGMFLMNRILDLVLRQGIRLAEPGEFTKRAFLGGRLDLSEAEAVMDLISSQSEFARKVSIAQLEGSLSSKVKSFREHIIYELAFIESALDDPENYDLTGYPERLKSKLQIDVDEMTKLLEHSEDGRILKEGITTVIVGKPNAGKSSLLNCLSGTERAIVTDIAGTTRDTLEENVRLNGISLRLIDTAGIRKTEDTVEQIGVQRAITQMQNSDLMIFILDSSEEFTAEDEEIASMFEEQVQGGTKGIVLLNKTDLTPKLEENKIKERFQALYVPVLMVSMKDRESLVSLEKEIGNLFHAGDLLYSGEGFLTNMRHQEAMQNACDSLKMVMQSIDDGMSEDFYAIDLMNSYQSLGLIIGEAVEDDLVEEIFTKFCLGK